MFRPCLTFALLAALLPGCVGSGDLQERVSGQIVGEDGKPLGPGLIMVERGPVHAGAYETGGLIDAQGRFSVDLDGGDTYGLHLFHSTYQYLPLEITIADHQQVVLTSMMVAWGVWMDLTGQPTWPDQPSDATLIRMPVDEDSADNPVIEDIKFTWTSNEVMEITAKVSDPDHDLSRMVLAYDPATRGGYALNPPSSPDSEGNYPDGVYKLKVFVDERHIPGKSQWHFIVSDNMCNNPPLVIKTMPKQ